MTTQVFTVKDDNGGRWSVNITGAKRLARFHTATRMSLASAVALTGDRVWIEDAHVPKVDLRHPIIIGVVAGRRMVIDGNHRIVKAKRAGHKSILARVLSDAEMARITRTIRRPRGRGV